MTGKRALLAVSTVFALAACGPGQVVVTMEIETRNAETGQMVTQPLADIEVRLFPFDRDAVFDSLASAAATPEPPIPDSVMEAQNAVRTAQAEWQQTQQRWSVLRERLETLNEEIGQLNRASGQYRVLYGEYQEVEAEYNSVDRQLTRSFDRFTDLQNASLAAAEEARLIREQWADDAYADVGLVIQAHLLASGGEIQYDTTDASGISTFEAKPGEWWVTARYELPFEELYWNLRFDLTRDAPAQIRLNMDNAARRPKL